MYFDDMNHLTDFNQQNICQFIFVHIQFNHIVYINTINNEKIYFIWLRNNCATWTQLTLTKINSCYFIKQITYATWNKNFHQLIYKCKFITNFFHCTAFKTPFEWNVNKLAFYSTTLFQKRFRLNANKVKFIVTNAILLNAINLIFT